MLRPFYFIIAALAFFAGAAPSHAQVFVVGTCGTVPTSQATLTAGNAGMYFVDTTGKLCVNATVSATATIAAFAPVGTNNAIAVTSTTARTALTGAAANSTTLVENSGATDVFVAFGDNTVTVTAANGTRVPAGWGIAFNIGASTNIAYITASSTSTINATTGTGLPALGAAGSGGSGGAVTNAGTFAVQLTGATNNINNIAGTVSLPTGAATAANQSTEITALNSIVTNTAAGSLVDETAFTEGTTSSILFGGYFKTAPTALTTGQSGALTVTADRKAITSPYADVANFGLNGEITAAMTGTTSTALTGMGAQAAGIRVYATACTFSNSHATVGTMILLQDGSGGATLWQAPAAPAFGGAVVVFPTPIKTTAATGLFAQNVTTGANTFVSCTGYKGI